MVLGRGGRCDGGRSRLGLILLLLRCVRFDVLFDCFLIQAAELLFQSSLLKEIEKEVGYQSSCQNIIIRLSTICNFLYKAAAYLVRFMGLSFV